MKALIKKKMFKSSVQLMLISRDLSSLSGITLAAAQMGTPANKSLLLDIGIASEILHDISEQDLIIVVKGRDEKTVAKALEQGETLLNAELMGTAEGDKNLREALSKLPGANMALISLPGATAVPVAKDALDQGLHVHLFSDNISVEDEIDLKTMAIENGLLMMGPDCGTAIVNGVPLGFANVVRRGNIGIVSAAGTGLQEVSCIIDRMGAGVSQAIGVGGRDLSSAVGGMMMMEGMKSLEKDPSTKVIVLISKPPSQDVLEKLVSLSSTMGKPVIMNFIGGKVTTSSAQVAPTMEEAAKQAVLLSGVEQSINEFFDMKELEKIIETEKANKNGKQKYLRGLFVGGTLCSEAISIMSSSLGNSLYTNISFPGTSKLDDVNKSIQNTCIDLGDDQFTKGMAHPMIDPTVRHLRMLKEGQDPSTAVLLLDFVLGYGAQKDPVGAVIPIIRDIKKSAQKDGRHITFVASVLGTDRDSQNRPYSIARLRDLGVLVGDTNAQAARIALAITQELGN